MHTSLRFAALFALLGGEGLTIDGQWTQCGGKREGIPWGPENTCNNAGGYYCVEVNEWYWQCRNDGGVGAQGQNYSATYLQGSNTPATSIQGAVQFIAQSTAAAPASSSPAPLFGMPVQNSGNSFLASNSKIAPGGQGDEEDECDDGDDENDEEEGSSTGSTPAATAAPPASSTPPPAATSAAASNIQRPDSFLAVSGPEGSNEDQFANSTSTGGTTSGSSDAGYDGYATTSRYGISSTSLTACGCAGSWIAPGDAPIMGAAINQAVYGDPSSCSSACGTCYELTSTGAAPAGVGPSGQKTGTITVMIVDACPVTGNEKFCSAPNQFGMSVHFDLAIPADLNHGPNGWDNPIVKYKKLDSCPGSSGVTSRAMTQKRQTTNFHDNFKTCRCGK